MSSDVFKSLICELDLIQANAEEYYGEINDQPIILTVLSADPPTIMFKIRINSEDEHNLEFPDVLSELIAEEKINVSVENGYGWLTFYHLSDYSVEAVLDLLAHFLQIIEDHELNLGLECAVCKNSDSGEIYYSDSNISRLCPNCFEAKKQQKLDKEKKLFEISTSSILLSLLGMMGFALIWTLMWFLYDYMFVLYGTDSIDVSDVVLVVGTLTVISVLSMTIGFPLRRFSIRNNAILIVTASVLVTISFVLGEILIATIWIFKEIQVINIIASTKYSFFLWQGEPSMFKAMKILLVIGSVIGIYLIAKKKKVAIEI